MFLMISLLSLRGTDAAIFEIVGSELRLVTDTMLEGENSGSDTLNFAGLTTSVIINLGSSDVQAIHTNRPLLLSLRMDVGQWLRDSDDESPHRRRRESRVTQSRRQRPQRSRRPRLTHWGSENDWYFQALDDVITDLLSGEAVDLL